MSANKITVTDKDIKYAEEILLFSGQTFDQQRCAYIRDFNSLDLMAVPGSGKTTLLLAKLLILEKHLPFPDNSGVLVISHTNTAVEEIKARIEVFCPKLFSYPNFVGTIQSFTNKYLALPFYESIFKKKIKDIGAESYNNEIEWFYENTRDVGLKGYLNRRHDPVGFLKNIRFNKNKNLVTGINGSEEDFKLTNKNKPTYKSIRKMKNKLLRKGVLHFDDAYFLAFQHIKNKPKTIEILQKRFRYVFVDEMQDMEIHQYELLEKVFTNKRSEMTSYQRLGDNNQAIFSQVVNEDAIWENRKNIHVINGSNRLTELNANLASRFSLNGCSIEGLNTADNIYKPILVVYDKEKIECSVIEAFSKHLSELFNKEDVKEDFIYKVISRRWLNEDLDKSSLLSYCPNYKMMKKDKNSVVSKHMGDRDYYDKAQIVITKIVEKLNEIGFKIEGQYINKQILADCLKDCGDEDYARYKSNLYFLTKLILNNDYTRFYKKFNSYLGELGKVFNFEEDKRELLNISKDDFDFNDNLDVVDDKCNKCNMMGIVPIMGSAHSVKGETHDITLFLESYYNKNYECDVLHEVLCGKSLADVLKEYEGEINQLNKEIKGIKDEGKDRGIKTRQNKIKSFDTRIGRAKEYGKLVYVALTRARSVVGYGISRERYDKYLKNKINEEEWDIILVTNEVES